LQFVLNSLSLNTAICFVVFFWFFYLEAMNISDTCAIYRIRLFQLTQLDRRLSKDRAYETEKRERDARCDAVKLVDKLKTRKLVC